MRNPTLSSLPKYKLALALSLLCGCDSLWSGFAKDDPSSCGSKDSQVVCSFPKICNQVSGQCELPSVIPQVGLEYASVAPNVVPFGGGQRGRCTRARLHQRHRDQVRRTSAATDHSQ